MTLNSPNIAPILHPKINSNIKISFNLLPLLPSFHEHLCGEHSVGQEEHVLLWVLHTLLQVWLSEQKQQHFPLGVWCHSPFHTQGMGGCGRRWTLIPGQHLTFHCLLKLRPTLCCQCSAFKQALSFWCLVQGFLFCLWVKILLTWDSFVRVFIPPLDVPPTQHHLKWKD